jgi:hypothetical protein
MSEMIERVALAISGSDDPANILAIHRSRARLAIEAMREPTEAMKAVTSENTWHAVQDWYAMIDEALK